mgnify:CR=1 FL=1
MLPGKSTFLPYTGVSILPLAPCLTTREVLRDLAVGKYFVDFRPYLIYTEVGDALT